jgi:hypothetical protein
MQSLWLKGDSARTPWFLRRALAILCMVTLALAGTAVTAAGEPRAQELWKAYPLDPQQERDATPAPGTAGTTTRGAQAPPDGRTTRATDAQSTAKRADSNSLEIAALALVALLATGVVGLRFSRQRSLSRAGGPRAPAGFLPPPAPVPALNPGRRSVPIRDFTAVGDGDIAGASESSTPPAPLGLPALAKRSLPDTFFERNGTETPPGQAAHDPRVEAAAPDVESSEPAAGVPASDAAKNGPPQTRPLPVPDSAGASGEAARPDSGARTSAAIARADSNARLASAAPANEGPPREPEPERSTAEPRSPRRLPSEAAQAKGWRSPEAAETAGERRASPERPRSRLDEPRAAAEAESSAEPPEGKPDRSPPESQSSRQPTSGPDARPASSRPRSGPEEWRDLPEAESKAEPPCEHERDRSDSAAQVSAERAAWRVDSPPVAKAESSKNKPSSLAQTAGERDAPRWAASKRANPRRPLQRCAIVAHRSGQTARFAVVAVDGDSRDGPPTAWSPSFAVSRAGAISNDRRARSAHDALVAQLAAVGWRQEESGGDWYEAVFVRHLSDRSGSSVNRATVVCRRLGREARFEAVQLDDYGNATNLAASPTFSARRRGSVRPTSEARALHDAIVRYLRRLGWEADQPPDGDWYATPLTRERL